MQTFALILVATAAMQTASPAYGPPAPVARPTPGLGPSIPSTAPMGSPDNRNGPFIPDMLPVVWSDIHDGRATGELTRGQAKQLHREFGEIEVLEQRYTQGGLSDDERAEIRNRVEVLRAITNAKRAGTIK